MMESFLSSKADNQDQTEADLPPDPSTVPDSQRSCTEEREHLQVYLRIRPFTSAESDGGESRDCVTIESPDTVLLKPPTLSLPARLSTDKSLPQTGQRFQFSEVYGPETTQKELFQGTVKDLVKDVLEGGNSLVFTYGVTNAGKTFTFLGPEADAGILPRSLDVIFSSIDEHVFTGTSVKPHRCREFTRLSREQQAEEALFKRNLFRQLKESEKSNASFLNSTNKTLLEGSALQATAEDRIGLELEMHTKFSVWVSFCEIYNENIHDLLEVAPSGALRRTALRLSQDVKGNAFVKDLCWVQVNSAEEAYKVMKVGKKNQSFSATRLNQLSSRSHSIFSIRILRIEGVEFPRVHTVSELSLCDLAGSERCAKTQNKGERLKEAGNINTSLLILGKCINALRHNQQAKLLQHVPFRESKLTHYLQGFFCGRGKACMIVNINQCASMYDETLNVLKFSAVAQTVLVPSTKSVPIVPQRSIGETSFIINGTDRKALVSGGRRSSLIGWDSSLEDVQEDRDDEDEEGLSLMEETIDQDESEECEDGDKILISKRKHQRQEALLSHLQLQLKKNRAENILMEARVREELSREFSELYSEMQDDHNQRLAREREILEDRAERRLEIFKNLVGKMATAGTSSDPGAGLDAVTMDKSLDSFSSELAGIKMAAEAAHGCLCSGRAGAPGDRRDAVEELEKKVLELSELRKMALKQKGGASRGDEEQVEPRGGGLQEALAALEKERKGREDALAALEYQTMGKEEALASLEEERKAREEALATLGELKRSKEEVLASLEEERMHSEKALEAERRGREEALKESGREISRLVEEAGRRQQEGDGLRQEVRELTAKLDATEQQVTHETERAERVFVQLQTAQAQLDELSKEIQEKTSQIHTMKQEVQTSAASSGLRDQLSEEVSELNKALAEEKERNESEHRRSQELEQELAQLAQKQLISDQQLQQLTEKLKQQEEASKLQAEELRKKLQEQEEIWQQPLDELRSKLECQERESIEKVEELRTKLEDQTKTSEQQREELNEKLREEEVKSGQQLEELKHDLRKQKATSDKLIDDLEQKLSEQEQAAELLKAEMEEARIKASSSSAAEEHLKRLNSDLQTEVESLRAKASNVEEAKESSGETEAQMEEKLAEVAKAATEKESQLKKQLLEKEAQVASLQKNLKEAQEQREEDESQAVQEARRREVERRRELLAVAHEAIAQKDEELEKKAEEISRLKENAKQELEKAAGLSRDLQRKEEDASDLREKLADYKKQIQQVQKEISAMREEEKVLRQKLSDTEKTKKQLQSDLATRDRTIQQLKVEQSSVAKSDQTLQLYQKACKDLESRERAMEDMRLALTEQEETQDQMEQVLEEKLNLIQELSDEVEKLKGFLLQQERGNAARHQVDSPSDELREAKQEAARAQDSLKLCTEKHQAERRKWLEEKLSLIGQAKEAEDKRNQEMRKFADDRERYTRQQSQLESLTSQLAEKEQTMETWRKERDTLVAALEVQLQKLLSSQAEKDKLIQQLRESDARPPQEVGDAAVSLAELQAALSQREVEIRRLKEELKASAAKREETVAQTKTDESPATTGKPQSEANSKANSRSGGGRDARASVSSQGSAGCPSVLDSSEISTENGRTSRFPRPELEISFSPLQPNRMALRRQGETNAVTVKITRSARKRKSGEMEKSQVFRRIKRRATREEEVEAENKRNTRAKQTPKLTPQQEKISSSAGRQDSQSSIHSRKEGALQKIGDLLQSSPTLLGSKAKKMMSLVSGRGDPESTASSSSWSRRDRKSKRKLYRPEISSPMEMPPHPLISREPEEKESDHQIIKWHLRSRTAK